MLEHKSKIQYNPSSLIDKNCYKMFFWSTAKIPLFAIMPMKKLHLAKV